MSWVALFLTLTLAAVAATIVQGLADSRNTAFAWAGLIFGFLGLVVMSWPPGLTSFECSETALLTHKALWRSELASMTSLPAAPPAQLSLFG